MGNTSIEILLAVLVATVFLGDFIWKKVKGRKTNQESSLEVEKNSGSKVDDLPNKGLNNFISRLKGYILPRKRNVTMFLLSIPLLKLLIHCTLIPFSQSYDIEKKLDTGHLLYDYEYAEIKKVHSEDPYHDFPWFGGNRSFKWYLDNIFTEEIVLFIPAIILPLLFVFLINDKIKAR